jgi:hypothetical protein
MSIFDIWNQVNSRSMNYELEVDIGSRGNSRKIVGIAGIQPIFEQNTSRIEAWVLVCSMKLLLMKTTEPFPSRCI